MVVIRSSLEISLMFPYAYLNAMPGQGQFTAESDRELVYAVMDQVLKANQEETWAVASKSPCHLAKARQKESHTLLV